ncbi:MAG: hypothetical protein H0W46_03525 [Acidimicrobiia bacterium]|nr:hypothetical protein [Acidimicrobiia bacterium]
MPATTPADLVISFRSLARRRREALGDTDPAAVAADLDELQRHVDAAAAAIGVPAHADAVAAAIEARRSDDWDDVTLDELRGHALDAGAALRRIAAVTAADD